ncbi:MAG: DUF2723 domain-containing protein [Bacteroidetes bacterium]|nr:DUF2723 domain-containing protein [Bacteroidota bacterium]MBU2636077.1 DUF2723 domain-containing protein [Bacteroidota bacterium]
MKKYFETNIANHLIGFGLSVGIFIVYLITLAPTVSFIDSGELSAVAATLGIAHPTGYPLFTILGWLFTKLPIDNTIIYKLNIMSALYGAASAYFFFLFLVSILEFLALGQAQTKNVRPGQTSVSFPKLYRSIIPAVGGTLLLAFSPTYWSQAVAVEVYSLHILFLSLILLTFFNAVKVFLLHKSNPQKEKPTIRELSVFALLLGMSFTNHMTTILLMPGLIYMFFFVYGFTRDTWRLILILLVAFVAGLSFYLYFPVRAANSPLLNWGNPVDLEKIFWHLSGKQYRVWIFSSTDAAVKQFKYFINDLPKEFNYIFLIVCLLGIWSLYKRRRELLIFTILLFIGCVGYSINYDIHDIDSYFLLAYFTLATWIAIGIQFILTRIRKSSTVICASTLFVIITFLPLAGNYQDVDESRNYYVEDYTKNMFESIDPNGIIISFQWDYFVSASYYYQLVEGFRSDVVVIDKELLRRSWYFKQLETQHPQVIKQSKLEIDAFLIELYKFEHNLPYAYEAIENRFAEVIRSIIEKNIDEQAVYVTGEIETQYLSGYEKIPAGLCFRIIKHGQVVEPKKYNFKYRSHKKRNKYIDNINELYVNAMIVNALYHANLNRFNLAEEFINKGLEINPTSTELNVFKGKLKGYKKE